MTVGRIEAIKVAQRLMFSYENIGPRRKTKPRPKDRRFLVVQDFAAVSRLVEPKTCCDLLRLEVYHFSPLCNHTRFDHMIDHPHKASGE